MGGHSLVFCGDLVLDEPDPDFWLSGLPIVELKESPTPSPNWTAWGSNIAVLVWTYLRRASPPGSSPVPCGLPYSATTALVRRRGAGCHRGRTPGTSGLRSGPRGTPWSTNACPGDRRRRGGAVCQANLARGKAAATAIRRRWGQGGGHVTPTRALSADSCCARPSVD